MGARKPPMMAGFPAEENLIGRAPKNVRKTLDVILYSRITHSPRFTRRYTYEE